MFIPVCPPSLFTCELFPPCGGSPIAIPRWAGSSPKMFSPSSWCRLEIIPDTSGWKWAFALSFTQSILASNCSILATTRPISKSKLSWISLVFWASSAFRQSLLSVLDQWLTQTVHFGVGLTLKRFFHPVHFPVEHFQLLKHTVRQPRVARTLFQFHNLARHRTFFIHTSFPRLNVPLTLF